MLHFTALLPWCSSEASLTELTLNMEKHPFFWHITWIIGQRGGGVKNYTFASPPLGQRSSFRIYTCWDLKWSFCLIQQHNIALHTHSLKGIGALSFTHFQLSIGFIVLAKKGETPQEVCRYNAVRKRSECKSSFDELVKGGWGLKWEMCEVGPLC